MPINYHCIINAKFLTCSLMSKQSSMLTESSDVCTRKHLTPTATSHVSLEGPQSFYVAALGGSKVLQQKSPGCRAGPKILYNALEIELISSYVYSMRCIYHILCYVDVSLAK